LINRFSITNREKTSGSTLKIYPDGLSFLNGGKTDCEKS